MNKDIVDEGQQANMRGIVRGANPYPYPEKSSERLDWDTGWLAQTQSWAKRPKAMCKGNNCTSLKGVNHSDECTKEHDDVTHVLRLDEI